MFQFSKQQMEYFQKAKQDRLCHEIAEDLSEFRADGVDDVTFEAWVRRRITAYTKKGNILQKRHVHLLCLWEASLGPDRFAELREQGLKDALMADASETQRMKHAMNVFRRYLHKAA